ncbi:MAG: hypothetical protein EXR75_04965 [Myxococcales bacterium]|nr:hypothetical protein [Myxococcales bacterium]
MLTHRSKGVATGTVAGALLLTWIAGACSDSSDTKLVDTTMGAQGGGGMGGMASSTSEGGSITFMQGPMGSGGATSVSSTATGMMAEGGTAEPTNVFDKHFPGASATDTISVNDIVIDKADGSVVLVGGFNGARDFDGPGGANAANSAGQADIFLVKYKQDGSYAWHKTFGSGDAQSAAGVTVDANGRIAVIGSFRGTFSMGGGNLTAGFQFPDIFIALFDKAGVHVASQRYGIGDPYNDTGNDIAFDSAGNLIVTGQFQSSINFGVTTLMASGGLGDFDMFVAKLQPSGNGFMELFAKSYGDAKVSEGLSVAAHSDGTILVGGWTDGAIDFGNGALTGTPDTEQALVARLATDGKVVHAKVMTGGEARTTAVAFAPNGDLVATGNFKKEIDFGNGALKALGASSDVFVARFGASGILAFDKQFGGTGSDDAADVAVDPAGYPVVVGSFQATLKINSMTTLTSMGVRDGWVAKVAPDDGHGYWGLGFGDASLQETRTVAIYPNGDTLFVGQYFGAVDLGNGAQTATNGSQAFFLAKFGP